MMNMNRQILKKSINKKVDIIVKTEGEIKNTL